MDFVLIFEQNPRRYVLRSAEAFSQIRMLTEQMSWYNIYQEIVENHVIPWTKSTQNKTLKLIDFGRFRSICSFCYCITFIDSAFSAHLAVF